MTLGRERPESSVSLAKDEWGEIVFPGCGNGQVIHRTPEDLGIARVVSDASEFMRPEVAAVVAAAPEALRTARWPTGATLDAMERRLGLKVSDAPKIGARKVRRAARARRDSLEGVTTRVVLGSNGRGVEVRMSAHAVMGAELIDGLADGAPAGEKGEAGEMRANDYDMQNEVNRKIIAAPVETSAQALAAELGVGVGRVYGVRSQAYRNGTLKKRSASELGKAAHMGRPKKTAVADRAGGTKRSAGAEALTLALARHDARAARTVGLELTESEVAALVGKLNDEQRGAFLAAGLKAALLIS